MRAVRDIGLMFGLVMGVLIPAGCLAPTETEVPLQVVVDPVDPLFGVPVTVRIEGAEPGATVTLGARSKDGTGLIFESTASYLADAGGVVDIARQAPVSGGYEGADALGIFYSMQPVGIDKKGWRNYSFTQLEHITVSLEVSTAAEETAVGEVRWHFQAPGSDLVRTEITEEGLYGVLHRPAGEGPYPGLILLGGSGGGIDEWWARTMAANGFASLTLAYFNYQDQPKVLMEIPLETVERGLGWLRKQAEVDPDRIAVMGGSKGGELAILAAATYSQIKAVVGCVASGIVWQCDDEVEVASSWTLDGQGLAYARWFFSPESMERYMAGESVALRGAYAMEKNDPETLAAATIKVENINGPVLLVSGTDDQMWPSDIMADRIMARLKEHGHPHERRHLKVEGGGHLVFLPVYMTGGNREPVPFMFGGTAAVDAHGSAEFWKIMLEFLHHHLD